MVVRWKGTYLMQTTILRMVLWAMDILFKYFLFVCDMGLG